MDSLVKCCTGPNSPLKVPLTHMICDDPYVDMNYFHPSHEESDYVVNDNNGQKSTKGIYVHIALSEILVVF